MNSRRKINILIEHGLGSINKESLAKVADETLRSEGIKNNIELNILLTDDKKIISLNRQFLGRPGATDVISFGSKRLRGPSKALKGFIGEIAVSQDVARHNSVRFGTTVKKEIFLYVIHGILHLLGYGDKTKKEQRVIQERQTEILEAICGRLNS